MDDGKNRFWSNNQGFSLLEILLSISILALVAGPFVSLIGKSLTNYQDGREGTKAIYEAQGLLEEVMMELDKEDFPTWDTEYRLHPRWPEWEYRVLKNPHMGTALQEITVEIRETKNIERKVIFVSLKARRKYNGWNEQ